MALPTIEQVLASPATHNWLKSALTSALDKDPVDASYDAELLAKLLRARLDSILGMHRNEAGDLLTYEPIPMNDPRRDAWAADVRQGHFHDTFNVYSRRPHRSA